jgi:hypothetical protein
MEYVKSTGNLQAVMVNPKRGVLIEEMERLLKIWLDDQAQKSTAGSQTIISAKAKSLYDGLKKRTGESVTAMAGLIDLREGQICIISTLVVRLQVPKMMLPQLILHN